MRPLALDGRDAVLAGFLRHAGLSTLSVDLLARDEERFPDAPQQHSRARQTPPGISRSDPPSHADGNCDATRGSVRSQRPLRSSWMRFNAIMTLRQSSAAAD